MNGFKTRVELAFCFHQKHHIGQIRISDRFKNPSLLKIVRYVGNRFLNGILTRENTFTSEKSENKWNFCILTSKSFLLLFYLECFLFLNDSCKGWYLYDVHENFLQQTMERQPHCACERTKSKSKYNQVTSHTTWPRALFFDLVHKQCNGFFFYA